MFKLKNKIWDFYNYARNLKVNKDKNFDICFVWIPKAAGTSVFRTLSDHSGMRLLKRTNDFVNFDNKGVVTFAHVHYLSLLRCGFVSKQYHENSYKFSIVRNPYDRVASLYNYLAQGSRIKGWDFDRFLYEVENNRPPIGLYNTHGISHANPQADWIIDQKNQFIVDEVFKLDRMDDLYEKLNTNYNLSINSIKRENISPKIITFEKDILNHNDRIDLINRVYRKDFNLFDFKML